MMRFAVCLLRGAVTQALLRPQTSSSEFVVPSSAKSLTSFRIPARRILLVALLFGFVGSANATPGSEFDFQRDTLSFANWTVFSYENGKIVSHKNQYGHHYSRRCFVMTRTVDQFYKFARFEPAATRVADNELHKRIRAITRKPPWHDALPPEKRIVVPGYRDLRELSAEKMDLMQRNIGLGWVVYLRPGNVRMFYEHGKKYQQKTHDQLERSLARGEFFIGYLSDFPILHINHSVLVYKHSRPRSSDGSDHYLVYDPNHPDRPRHLEWLPAKQEFSFEKDREFAGGFTRVFQIYGKPLQ